MSRFNADDDALIPVKVVFAFPPDHMSGKHIVEVETELPISGDANHFFVNADKLLPVLPVKTDALALIAAHDSPDTLFYIDPPYPQELRASRYAVEFDRHAELLKLCRTLKGKVVISSYMNEQYSQMLEGWHVESRRVTTTQCVERDEVIWMNFRPQGLLF